VGVSGNPDHSLGGPPTVSAPLANSSIAWIPSTRLSNEENELLIPKVVQNSDWAALRYPVARLAIVVNAASMALRDPHYAFDRTSIPIRRYFSLSSTGNEKGVARLPLPYFDVSFRWIDASDANVSANAGNPNFSDISGNSLDLRADGTIDILRDNEWTPDNSTPTREHVFTGKKIIAMKISTLAQDQRLKDGSFPTANSSCPPESSSIAKFPDVEMKAINYFWSDPE
jgi:hypothetical protein